MSYRVEVRGFWGIVEEHWQDAPGGLPLRLLAFRMKRLGRNEWGPWHHIQDPIKPKERSA